MTSLDFALKMVIEKAEDEDGKRCSKTVKGCHEERSFR